MSRLSCGSHGCEITVSDDGSHQECELTMRLEIVMVIEIVMEVLVGMMRVTRR